MFFKGNHCHWLLYSVWPHIKCLGPVQNIKFFSQQKLHWFLDLLIKKKFELPSDIDAFAVICIDWLIDSCIESVDESESFGELLPWLTSGSTDGSAKSPIKVEFAFYLLHKKFLKKLITLRVIFRSKFDNLDLVALFSQPPAYRLSNVFLKNINAYFIIYNITVFSIRVSPSPVMLGYLITSFSEISVMRPSCPGSSEFDVHHLAHARSTQFLAFVDIGLPEARRVWTNRGSKEILNILKEKSIFITL